MKQIICILKRFYGFSLDSIIFLSGILVFILVIIGASIFIYMIAKLTLLIIETLGI